MYRNTPLKLQLFQHCLLSKLVLLGDREGPKHILELDSATVVFRKIITGSSRGNGRTECKM